MLRSSYRNGFTLAPALGALLAIVALGCAGCATQRPQTAGPAPSAVEVRRALLGRNPGLNSLRAVVEARISFGGRQVSLPGVLQLDVMGGFRLDVLDPLDRPLAIFFVEDGRIVQLRPGLRLASSLGVFPEGCRSVDPADWVPAITASSLAPVVGERLVEQSLWGVGRSLGIRRGGQLHQSIRYRDEGGQLRPSNSVWYCGDDPVLQLRVREWVQSAAWLLPSIVDVEYPKAGLAVRLELREIEGNPAPTSQPFRPRLDSDIRWTSWNLPH